MCSHTTSRAVDTASIPMTAFRAAIIPLRDNAAIRLYP